MAEETKDKVASDVTTDETIETDENDIEEVDNTEVVSEPETEIKDQLKKEDKKEKKDRKQKEIESLQDEVKSKAKDLVELKDRYLRTLAETENFKKRISEEASKDRKYANFDLCKELLETLDNFERAIDSGKEIEEVQNYLKGFSLIKDRLVKVLNNHGVTEIEAMGKPFDPNYQQAVMVENHEDIKHQEVIKVLQKGYMFKDRVLRPAMVIINE